MENKHLRAATALFVAFALVGCSREEAGTPRNAGASQAATAEPAQNETDPVVERELTAARNAYGKADHATALIHFRNAAQAGDADAQYYTGLMFADGQGTEQNYPEAVRWYQKAAEQNHPDALVALARLYVFGLGVDADSSKAVELYDRAAQAYPPGEDRERATQQKLALMQVLEEEPKEAQ